MNDHRCAECGKGEGETKFRLNGSGRLRKYCEECSRHRERRLRKNAPPAPDDTPRVADGYEMMPYQGAMIAWDTDGGMVCLTDLWRAAGSPLNKEPYKWLRSDQAQEYIGACARRGIVGLGDPNGIVYSRTGGAGGGGTWREKIIGLAYAQYLNADLYVACNQFILERWGQARQSGSIEGLVREIAEQLGILPRVEAKQDALLRSVGSIGQTLAGADRIEIKQYHRGRIYIGVLTDPLTIQSVRRELLDAPADALIVFIGQTKPGEGQECLRIRDYGSKLLKMRPTYYEVLAAFDTDSPDGTESLLLSNPPHGATRATLESRKKSQSFHVATAVALAGYRSLSRDYYAASELQSSWVITSQGPGQMGLWSWMPSENAHSHT